MIDQYLGRSPEEDPCRSQVDAFVTGRGSTRPLTDLVEESRIVESILVHRNTPSISSNLGEEPTQKCYRVEISLVTDHLKDGDSCEHHITSQEEGIGSQGRSIFEDSVLDITGCERAVRESS